MLDVILLGVWTGCVPNFSSLLSNFKTPKGRGDISKVRVKRKVIKFIDESYNANPLSVHSAIKNFDLIKKDLGKKNLILGDMLELGKHSKKLHEKLANVINASKIDNVHVYGNNIKHTFKKITKKKRGLILKDKNLPQAQAHLEQLNI